MRLHRFYVGELDLASNVLITDAGLLWQWNKVLRVSSGQKVILFNRSSQQAEFSISEISKNLAVLEKGNDLSINVSGRDIWLFWSLLKRDNNELILQKCTELGVTNFVPFISDRTIKKDFNVERAKKIVIEAAEQCGRSEIPNIFSPTKLEKIIDEYGGKIQLFIADQSGQIPDSKFQVPKVIGILVGPEGGWSNAELKLFEKYRLKKINIGQFTLRAETAAIVATAKLL